MELHCCRQNDFSPFFGFVLLPIALEMSGDLDYEFTIREEFNFNLSRFLIYKKLKYSKKIKSTLDKIN